MRFFLRFGMTVALLVGASGLETANAQYYDDGYDVPPRRERYEGRYSDRIPIRRPVGLNCDALQPGLTGPQPYSCPLPGPRPLGARCYCETPIAPMSGGDTVAGHVVP